MIKIISCHIDNYGCYSNEDFTFKDNITIIKKDNGKGKTTLKNFIIDMLFSEFNGNYRNGNLIQKGSLAIDIDGTIYNIFGESGTTRKGKFKVLDSTGKLQSLKSIGQDLLKMDREVFKKIFSISKLLDNDELFTNLTDNSTSRKIASSITSVLAGATSDTNVGTYKENLKTYINALKKKSDGLDDEIYELNRNVITISEDEIYKIEEDIDNCKEKIKNLDEDKEKYAKNLGAMDASIEDSNKYNLDKENLLKKYNDNLISMEEYQKYNNLKQYTTNKTKTHSFVIILLVISLIILGLGIVVSILASNIAPACVGFATSVIVFRRLFKRNQTDEEKEIINIKSKYNYNLDSDELLKDLQNFEQIQTILEDIQIRSCKLSSQSYQSDEFSSIQEEINYYRELELSLNDRINESKNSYKNHIQQTETIKELSETKAQIDEKLEFYKEILEIINQAEENIKNKFGLPIKTAFENYIKSFNVNSIKDLKNITLNKENFEISFIAENGLNNFKTLSDGQKAVLEIAAKLAVSDCLSNIKNGPIIMDDPMTNLDENAIVSISTILKDISKERQIIYFTCHSSREIK